MTDFRPVSELNGNGNNGFPVLEQGRQLKIDSCSAVARRQATRIQQLAAEAAEEAANASTKDEVSRARSKCAALAMASKAFDLSRARVRIEQGKADPGPFKSPGPTKSRKPRGQIKPIGPAEPEQPPISQAEVPPA